MISPKKLVGLHGSVRWTAVLSTWDVIEGWHLSLGVVWDSKHCNGILLIVVPYCTISLTGYCTISRETLPYFILGKHS